MFLHKKKKNNFKMFANPEHCPYRSFPISCHCKLDTGIHKPNVYPELQMQHIGCKWTCCSELPI